MKLKKEFLIGIVTLVGISVLVVGSFFLKGQEIWKSRFVYYSVFSNSEGLSTGRPVNLNGLQVGIITNINFQKNNLNNIVVEFELTDPNVKKLKNGSLVLLNSDLLSGSYLEISWGDSLDYYNSKDTIPSSVSLALEDQINERLIPLEKKTNELISTADSAIKTIEAIFSRNTDNLDESFDGIKNSIKNLEKVSLQISSLIRSEKENITQIVSNIKSLTSNLKESNDAINKILDNTAQLSDSLLASDIKGTINNAKQSLEEVNMILYDIKNGDGTLTRLINDSTIYLSVTQMIDEASRLVENIKTEPKRYVQFSIFGKTDKSILDSRDEKLLKKFAVDSLNF
ncbi:MAG: MlaD family protein [Flavobacteriales bacterium]|jgi:phospholipid/cholesterol/gamma-HCH transport system substrate-binding protein|tara:strand:- start:195 stop:1220 length:1026 start_codon:yes stop_codon:yes gene_type:complete